MTRRALASAPSPDLRARVLAEIARTPVPTRRQHRARSILVASAGALATAGLFLAMGGCAAGARSLELIAVVVGSSLVAAIALTYVAVAGTSMLGRPRAVLLAAGALSAVALGIVAVAAPPLAPAAALEIVPHKIDLACGLMTLVQGALPLAILLVPRRGSDPVHPVVTGAALGMAAGAWAATMAYLRCAHVPAAHSIVAHVVPMLVLAAAGALIGRRLLKLR